MGWSIEDAEAFRRYELSIDEDKCDYCDEVLYDEYAIQVSTAGQDYFVHADCVQPMAEHFVDFGYRRVFAYKDGLTPGTFICYTDGIE